MLDSGGPVPDVIPSSKTPALEKKISDHPSLKPQQLLRFLCRAVMPTEGVLLDPFMGSGSTIAACEALGIDSIGLELDPHYFESAGETIPKLASLYPRYLGGELEMDPPQYSRETSDQPLLLEEGANYSA